MSYLLPRLTGLIALVCCLLIIGSRVIGGMLPAVPKAVFLTAFYPNSAALELRIAHVDTRMNVVYVQRVKAPVSLPVSIDRECRILFPAVVDNQVKLASVDLKTGSLKYYLDKYNYNGTAGWLPDDRHIHAYYWTDTAPFHHYRLIDTVTVTVTPFYIDSLERDLNLQITGSPDSAYGLIVSTENALTDISLLETATGTVSPPVPTTASPFYWSPDSRYVAAGNRQHQLIVLDVDTMTWQQHEFAELFLPAGMVWTPQNNLLFIARRDGDMDFRGYRYSPKTNTFEAAAARIPAQQVNASMYPGQTWSPDGSKFFYEDNTDDLHVMDAQTRTQFAHITSPGGDSFARAVWSGDSRYLAAYNEYFDLLVLTDTVTGQQTNLMPGIDYLTFASFGERWLSSPEPAVFDSNTGLLRRLSLSGRPRFVPVYRLPGAYQAALCDPEETP